MSDAQYSKIIEMLGQVQTTTLSLVTRMDRLEQKLDQHIAKSAKEHTDIIAIVKDTMQQTSTLIDGAATKCTSRFKRQAGRIHTLEKAVL